MLLCFRLQTQHPSPLSLHHLFPYQSLVFSETHFRVFHKMALRFPQISGLSLSNMGGNGLRKPKFFSFSLPSFSDSSSLRFIKRDGSNKLVVYASSGTDSAPITGVVFEPFEEVKKDFLAVPIAPQVSLARQRYLDESEAAINEQINVEYNVSYVYHALYAYFDRDNIALKGHAKFYKESSGEEREHAEKLIKYQNTRGGKVILHSILNPLSEFEHAEKGDALYAMELALSLEKLTNEKLLSLHSVADSNNDPQLADFIESEFLTEQVEAIKKVAEYVAQLRRVGKGHGVWHFDQRLLHEGDAA
ncbi:Ferritin [Quillaja saponaria]|uniref:Ferritin n=1 Tax=Quillaja saponaria TaxID=32244 RepID=A0AAD7LN28_QUISA|nr:Ferritin [Quillaja saponaria]